MQVVNELVVIQRFSMLNCFLSSIHTHTSMDPSASNLCSVSCPRILGTQTRAARDQTANFPISGWSALLSVKLHDWHLSFTLRPNVSHFKFTVTGLWLSVLRLLINLYSSIIVIQGFGYSLSWPVYNLSLWVFLSACFMFPVLFWVEYNNLSFIWIKKQRIRRHPGLYVFSKFLQFK